MSVEYLPLEHNRAVEGAENVVILVATIPKAARMKPSSAFYAVRHGGCILGKVHLSAQAEAGPGHLT